MSDADVTCQTGAEALLAALKQEGVEYLFANAGTDFLPIIEGLSRLPANAVPRPLTIPHETAAVAMAHGYWLVTGAPQAVMVHVNVGLANAVMGVINAMSDNIPMLVLSGRTPLTETGRKGGRVSQVQYGQEMPDQTSLVRNSVKYDYEMRYPEQGDMLVRRASAITRAEPTGPVYLSLPREPLCDALPETHKPAPRIAPAAPPAPDPQAISTLAAWLHSSTAPVILCQRGDPEGRLSAVLSHVAAELGIAVCEPFTVRNVLASSDPALISYDAAPIKDADLIIVLDCPVPWVAAHDEPNAKARVVHIAPDPHFSRMSVRGYRSDLTVASEPIAALEALHAASETSPRSPTLKKAIAIKNAARMANLAQAHEPPPDDLPMSPEWFSRCVSDAMDDEAVAFNELGLLPEAMTLKGPNRLLSHPHSGGLGWALPAALGAQLANRSRLVIAAMGDGSYIFANPVACHQIAEALELPVLIVVKNNAMWNAVRRSVVHGYSDGAASRQNEMPLTSLEPMPDFSAIARASNAHAQRVEHGRDLPQALANAINVITTEKRHALLDVRVAATDAF